MFTKSSISIDRGHVLRVPKILLCQATAEYHHLLFKSMSHRSTEGISCNYFRKNRTKFGLVETILEEEVCLFPQRKERFTYLQSPF